MPFGTNLPSGTVTFDKTRILITCQAILLTCAYYAENGSFDVKHLLMNSFADLLWTKHIIFFLKVINFKTQFDWQFIFLSLLEPLCVLGMEGEKRHLVVYW